MNNNVKNKLKIREWNIYIANIYYIDSNEWKQRPVIVLYIIGNSATIIPLTTKMEKEHWSDVKFLLNKKENRAKLNNIQRIHINNIKKPALEYNENSYKYARLSEDLRKEIEEKFKKLFFPKNNINLINDNNVDTYLIEKYSI
ncbi:hypothetical protein [Spiroplasma endosymbiont of Polydrusus pterygomalis]|uniref:hypothetical protein n=1 Tax=Spiroplasma endosymbiont of Polydrusus pterygomalis TaxID=3139327 RepID=UPI003CCA8174